MVADPLLGLLLCPVCRGDWPAADGCCRRCQALLFGDGAGEPLALPGLAALGYYRGELAAAVRALKFRGARRLARPLARCLAAAVTARGWRPDAVTYAPMHWARRGARAFDQARILAAGLAEHLDMPSHTLLRRSRATRQQSRLSASERRNNLAAAFHETGPAKGTVLLVDDVFTTGATLAACREVLEYAGADLVLCAVVAVAPRSGGRDEGSWSPGTGPDQVLRRRAPHRW
jgi:ComF family protein